MILSRRTRSTLLVLMLVATLAPSAAAQPDDALYQAIDKACSDAETELTAALGSHKWTQPSECKSGNDFDETDCRSALESQIQSVIKSTMRSQKQKIRKAFLTTLADQPADQVGPLYKTVDQVLNELSHEIPKVDVIEKGVKELSAEELKNPDQHAKQISKKVVIGFGQTCRTRAVAALAKGGRDDAGSDYLASLQKRSGFSKIVRCEWRTDGHHHLDCAPGLQVTGHEVAMVEILPPRADSNFRLTWVQAIGAEELPGTSNRASSKYLDKLHCPGYPGEGEENLACDELCFGDPGPCDPETYRPLAIQSAVVAVHTQRRFSTSYGCAVHRRDCAQRRLRPNDRTKTQPAKLTLLTRGRTPMIRVRAMDQNGNVAEGEVLVGYPRWRVESGGFMGIAWNAVDHEVVTRDDPTEEAPGQVKVVKIRDSDTYAQETGIFVNLIPSNYEYFGVSLGFATADGKAPSVYLGPTVRVMTFGNRGLAALSAGVVMRQVDRFPDLTVDQELAGNSRLLEPDRQFEVDGYLGIQLGFSFGPISVPGTED